MLDLLTIVMALHTSVLYVSRLILTPCYCLSNHCAEVLHRTPQKIRRQFDCSVMMHGESKIISSFHSNVVTIR